MFDIKILASGSRGNCYVIEDGENRIMIDPGIPIKEIRKKCDFNLATIDLCLVSHEHKDHCKAIKEIIQIGIIVGMSAGTSKHILPEGALYISLEDSVPWAMRDWRILPFRTEHDAEEPLGFLIQTPSGKKICYATDTYYIRYKFSGVTHWMIEANYSEKFLKKNTALHDSVKSRIRSSHFEIENVKTFFTMQDLSKTKEIYLIHLSEDNSDVMRFQRKIEAITGMPVITHNSN